MGLPKKLKNFALFGDGETDTPRGAGIAPVGPPRRRPAAP